MSVLPSGTSEAVAHAALPTDSRQHTQARTASQSSSHSVTFRSLRATTRRARMMVAAPNVTVTATMISGCLLAMVLGEDSPRWTAAQLRAATSHFTDRKGPARNYVALLRFYEAPDGQGAQKRHLDVTTSAETWDAQLGHKACRATALYGTPSHSPLTSLALCWILGDCARGWDVSLAVGTCRRCSAPLLSPRGRTPMAIDLVVSAVLPPSPGIVKPGRRLPEHSLLVPGLQQGLPRLPSGAHRCPRPGAAAANKRRDPRRVRPAVRKPRPRWRPWHHAGLRICKTPSVTRTGR